MQVLVLVHIGDAERAGAPSNLNIVDRPGNILGCPNNLIVVPVSGRVEISHVLAVHLLVTVDEVREEWILFNCRYYFDVDLLPIVIVPWQPPAPVEEE